MSQKSNSKIRLALLISGAGTTMEAIIKATQEQRLNGVEPLLIIASTKEAEGIRRAEALGFPQGDVVVINPKNFATPEEFGEKILAECVARNINFIGQYGWLPKTPANVIEKYRGRIVNQHPVPLDPGHPDFGGKGMWGRRAVCARLLFVKRVDRDYWTEATTHLVEEEFDKGVVLKAIRAPIQYDDTVETLDARLRKAEHIAQIETLRDFVNGTVSEVHRATSLVFPGEVKILEECKEIAMELYPHG